MTIHSVVIQKLLSTNAHLGRRVAENHFKIYTYGTRNAMAIIDSDKTLICLRSACNFIGNLVRQKGRFLFVHTNPLVDEIVEQMIQRIGCKNDNSWRLGGFLTNSSSPKKFKSRNKKLNLGSIYPPDCVVIMDTERKSSVILEADKLQIPVVGLVDSSMPWEIYKRIAYPIPANDSVQFVYLFCNMITKTFLYEQKKLDTANGNVTKEEAITKTGEATQRIERTKIEGTNYELFVVPYESLLPASEDPLEIRELLNKLVVLKINRNLGTRMGFDRPKSTINVCNGFTCLDVIASRIESLNLKYGCNIPLLLMNASSTNDETLKVLEKHSNRNVDCFIQDVNAKDFMPWPLKGKYIADDPLYASNHGEALLSLKRSGKLEALLSQGLEYILMLDSDNLADVADPIILNHLIENDVQYCMEVTSSSHDNYLEFQSEEKSTVMMTSNIWVKIEAVETLDEDDLFKENHPISELFNRAIGLNVPRSRFLPLETTSDLLLFQSDLYTCVEGILIRNAARGNSTNPSIMLGPEFRKVLDFQSRFKTIPSNIELDSLKVTGDVWFGGNVTLKGRVSITAKPGAKITIPDGVVLENKAIYSQQDIVMGDNDLLHSGNG